MVCFRKLVLAAVASGILTLGNATFGGVIYDNLPPDLSSSGGKDPVNIDGPIYNSFSTGNTTSNLLDVTLWLSKTLGTPPGSFTVSLLSDVASNPGSLLETLGTYSDGTLSTTAGGYDISGGNYALAADTRYWIELSSALGSTSLVAWDYASNVTGRGIAGEYSAYTSVDGISVSGNSHSTPPYLMQVSTTQSTGLPPVIEDPTPIDPNPPGGGGTPPAVPEPGTLCQALTALAIGCVVMARRRVICA